MKMTLSVLAFALSNFSFINAASAQGIPGQMDPMPGVVVSSKIVTVPIEVNSKMVKFSKADYSMPVVKILIPALADVTLLNHRNTREGAPCLAAYGAASPDDVIQGRPASETAELKIELLRQASILNVEKLNPDGTKSILKSCEVSLIEVITGKIRGQDFYHDRISSLPNRHLDDCR